MTALDMWGTPFLALIAFANSIPFLSYLIPAEPAFAFAGTRIASGTGWSWLIAAYVGAWCGCQCSFWIGRLAGNRFVDRVGADGGVIARIRGLYERRGPMMVVIAQMIAPLSTLAQAMAGVFGMNPRTYAVISLLGAAIEIGQYALLGYLGATVLAAFGLTPGQFFLEWVGPYAAFALLTLLIVLGGARIVRRGHAPLGLRFAYACAYSFALVVAVSLGSLAISSDREALVEPVPFSTACGIFDQQLVASAGPTPLHPAQPINLVLTGIDPEAALAEAGWLRSPAISQGNIDVLEHAHFTWSGLPPASTLLVEGRATALAWQEARGAIPRVQLRLWPVAVPDGAPSVYLGSVARIDGVSFLLDGWLPTLTYDLEAKIDIERDRFGATLSKLTSARTGIFAPAAIIEDGGYETDGRVIEVKQGSMFFELCER